MLPACNTEAMQLHLDEIATKVPPGDDQPVKRRLIRFRLPHDRQVEPARKAGKNSGRRRRGRIKHVRFSREASNPPRVVEPGDCGLCGPFALDVKGVRTKSR